jgi:hypothetical protein
VDNDNVIPFRKRPPSEKELEVYRQITRNWDPALRQMMFPEHFKHEQDSDESSR